MKFENIDLIDALRRITDLHTKHYKEDFEQDQKLLRELAASSSSEDKHLLWMSRPLGTYLLREREAYIKDTFENSTWEYYRDQTNDPVLAYSVEITDMQNGVVRGNLIELDYAAHVDRLKQLTVELDKVAVTFEDEATYSLPFKSYRREVAELQPKHGKVQSVTYLPENEKELEMILRRERFKTSYHAKAGHIDDHIQRLAVQHGLKMPEEKLASMPISAQTAYNEIKEVHPDAIVCFAQSGYFEIYGEDAKKAAPILGTKLLMKDLEAGGQVSVTGFREELWVANAKKLWSMGNDVLLTQLNDAGKAETVKHLRAEEYIPIGVQLEMSGRNVRVDAVDFQDGTVRLTDLSDPKQPLSFQESVAVVRSYVEEASPEKLWAAMERGRTKTKQKPSVMAKLKEKTLAASEQKAKKPEIEKTSKSKEMEM